MNTINLNSTPNMTIILPRIGLWQQITVHNPDTGETITFKNEVIKPDLIEPAQKSWKPKLGEKYLYVDEYGETAFDIWENNCLDELRYSIGNCYQLYKRDDEVGELAIWEQFTRKKYEKALWDAADLVDGEWYAGLWQKDEKRNQMESYVYYCEYLKLPRFATRYSCLDAHTRILGDDAERYFKGRF